MAGRPPPRPHASELSAASNGAPGPGVHEKVVTPTPMCVCVLSMGGRAGSPQRLKSICGFSEYEKVVAVL